MRTHPRRDHNCRRPLWHTRLRTHRCTRNRKHRLRTPVDTDTCMYQQKSLPTENLDKRLRSDTVLTHTRQRQRRSCQPRMQHQSTTRLHRQQHTLPRSANTHNSHLQTRPHTSSGTRLRQRWCWSYCLRTVHHSGMALMHTRPHQCRNYHRCCWHILPHSHIGTCQQR